MDDVICPHVRRYAYGGTLGELLRNSPLKRADVGRSPCVGLGVLNEVQCAGTYSHKTKSNACIRVYGQRPHV